MQTSTIVFKTEPEFRISSGAIVSSSTSSPSSSGVGNMRPPPPPPPPKIKLHENKLEEPTSSIPDLGEFCSLALMRAFALLYVSVLKIFENSFINISRICYEIVRKKMNQEHRCIPKLHESDNG